MLTNRPFTILGIITGLHSLLYGLGFVFDDDFRRLRLYDAVEHLPFDNSVLWFGWAGVAVGILTIFSFFTQRNTIVEVCTYVNAVFWLFATFVYFHSGAPLLGLAIGATWAIFSWYVGFLYKNRIGIAHHNIIRDNNNL